MNDREDFYRLREADLSEIRGEAWDAHLTSLAPWLRHADADIRELAVERLGMGVLWAERASLRWGKVDGVAYVHDPLARLSWLIHEIEAAHALHPDVLPAFLKDLRHKGDTEPFRSPLVHWLEGLLSRPAEGVDAGVIEGTIVLLGRTGGDDAESLASLTALLDHPHSYVRACAARKIGEIVRGPDAAPMFALIGEKELESPGVAGPFWTEWHGMTDGLPVDPVEWMLELLERRKGPVPKDLPFNDIDFYLHELCDHSPEAVRRMIQSGHICLAAMTATENPGFVPGMEKLLIQLSARPEAEIARQARFHLARYYRLLPEGIVDAVILRRPNWSAEAEIVSFHRSEGRSLWYIVAYPAGDGAAFDDATAWRLVDRLLPPALRGEPVRHQLDLARNDEPHLWRLGSALHQHFASGAQATFVGDPDAKLWTRIEIGGGQLEDRWRLFD